MVDPTTPTPTPPGNAPAWLPWLMAAVFPAVAAGYGADSAVQRVGAGRAGTKAAIEAALSPLADDIAAIRRQGRRTTQRLDDIESDIKADKRRRRKMSERAKVEDDEG